MVAPDQLREVNPKAVYVYCCGGDLSKKRIKASVEEINLDIEFRVLDKFKLLNNLGKFNTQNNQIVTLATYGDNVSYEIKLSSSRHHSCEYIEPKIGLAIQQALSIACPSNGFCFMCADTSWGDVESSKRGGINILDEFLPPSFATFRMPSSSKITETHVKWAADNWADYILMRKNNASFDLAASIYSSYFRSDNPRLIAIDLWSAIEALCGIDSGLRNGIALNVSYFLNHNRSKRLDMYKKIKKMYDKRSSIVHGRKISQEDILLHIQELINILSKVLKKCLDRQILPTTENLFMK